MLLFLDIPVGSLVQLQNFVTDSYMGTTQLKNDYLAEMEVRNFVLMD